MKNSPWKQRKWLHIFLLLAGGILGSTAGYVFFLSDSHSSLLPANIQVSEENEGNTLGYWKFEENLKNEISLKNDLKGSFTGSFSEGEKGKSLVFSGEKGNLFYEIPQNTTLKSFTVSMWFLSPENGNFEPLFLLGESEKTSTGIALDSKKFGVQNGIRYWLTIGGKKYQTIVRPDINYHDNEWHHVQMEYTGTEVMVAVDKKEESRKKISGTLDAQNKFFIGTSPDGDTQAVGKVDEVKFEGE